LAGIDDHYYYVYISDEQEECPLDDYDPFRDELCWSVEDEQCCSRIGKNRDMFHATFAELLKQVCA
jgi:hypothetical protein